ncbi:YtxH domain-containing protein [Companilactobacillus baiquanensis]|uniref:YtxH domain-containing protein n=1 Tax=Companilactobacillus baiquanensis TaxID=2486005 RepID=A0ABW1UX59_9LACO|nr:YtxH domain-containing protein [Companilactobacillus baiquanensis]
MKNKFALGLALGGVVGYAASKYLASESGQKLLENVQTIRGDFNNGGVGLADAKLMDSFNEKTDELKNEMLNTADKIDNQESNIVFDEEDIKK